MLVGKIVFLISLILQNIIRFPYRSGRKAHKDRQEQLLLLLLAVGGLLIPLIYIFTDWLAFADYPAPSWLIGLGIVVMTGGLWLFWRAHVDLGRNWSDSLEIHDDHTLITHGVYRRIRHPMYAASWLMMLAPVFLFPNWIAGFSGIVAFSILYFLRVPQEEQMMQEAYGDQYRRYLATTGRVLPKF